MVLTQLLATAVTVAVFVYLRRFLIGRGREVFAKAPAAEWLLSGFLAILGAWVVLNIWGVFPILTNTAVIGVWLFFALWFAKDFFIDDYLAGIKLIAFYKLSPGARVNVLGMDCEIVDISPRSTTLRTPKGRLVVPNSRLLQLGLILPGPEEGPRGARGRP
jgi:small-conductance mechanosensitive channel